MSDYLIDMGSVEVITGPMFSGKSEELIRRVKRAKIAKLKVKVFKPLIDNRYSKEEIASHSGILHSSIVVKSSGEIMSYIDLANDRVIAIDEVQFFDKGIVEVVNYLADNGKRVILAGLDMDFKGKPFGYMPQLLAIADRVDKLKAICVKCGREASFTQRLVSGKEAYKDSPTILVGGYESYEPRCRKCHIVRSRDSLLKL